MRKPYGRHAGAVGHPFAQHQIIQHGGIVDRRKDELDPRSEEHTSELQSLMRISYAVFCLKKKKRQHKCTIDRSEQNKENKKRQLKHAKYHNNTQRTTAH